MSLPTNLNAVALASLADMRSMAPYNKCGDEESLQLEDFRPGYPRFAVLLSRDNGFFIFRRFSRSRLRLLLLKQDEVCKIGLHYNL